MFRSGCKFTAASVLVCLVCGCGKRGGEPIVLDTSGVVPAADYTHLARVLADVAMPDGFADLYDLRKQSEALEAQLRLLAVTGPTATPELLPAADDAPAYWYNARAAWSMKLLLIQGCPETVDADAYFHRPLPLDGRTMSLSQIDAELAKDADFRVVACAPGATAVEAALPSEPLRADRLRADLAGRLAALIDDEQRFVVDIPRKQVRLPPSLWRVRGRVIDAHHAAYGTEGATLMTALLPYVFGSPHRRLQDAVGFRCVEEAPRKLRAKARKYRVQWEP